MSLHPATDSIRRDPDEGITIYDHQVSTDEMSVVRAELHGEHIGHPNRRSTTVYIVTDGTATIMVGETVHTVTTGDMVLSPPHTRRKLNGSAALLIINTPPFDPDDER